MEAPSVPSADRVTSVTMDDIIYRLQEFGGASDFWRALSAEVERDRRLQVDHVRGHVAARIMPVNTHAEVLHSSHFRVPFRRSTKCVTTIHDLTYELGLVGGLGRHLNLWQRKRAVARADVIVCISDHTKAALQEFYGPTIRAGVPIVTIPHGRSYDAPTGNSLPDRLPHDRPFLLHVGNRAGYKNFTIALRAFAASTLPSCSVELWCTGRPFDDDERRLIENAGLHAQLVRDVGNLSYDELGTLYEHSMALVYPSSYEGFGLPPLDAMSLGCPVIASNNSSVPEVVGDAGLLVDPTDLDGFSAAMERILDSSEQQRFARLGLDRARAFSWSAAANAYARLYETVLRSP